jgi:UDP-N-acetylglucosamine--N-acetylmuramyl-(pentapeptide) pyrophosphoryl-undecaprenol N-acetylglucosamine transferase
MSKKIIIAGGGTGGHVFPAIAIGQALQRLDDSVELLFVGAKGKMEMEKVPQAGFPIVGLDIAGLNRSAIWKNVGLPLKLLKSLYQASGIIRRFKPDAVVGVGGYASFPLLRRAQKNRIPTLIQEQNSYAGKSNKILGQAAKRICVGYEGMELFFPAEKIILTGNPVRPSISGSKATREDGIRFFQLDPSKKVVLVIGGSLGAKSINEAVYAGLDRLSDRRLQLIWQTGKGYIEKAVEASASRKGIWTADFITHMEMAYAAADIVVARAGALTIAELCVAGKPVVFVPYPFAAEDHQTVNAMSLVNKGAAMLVRDQDAKTQLMDAVLELAADETRQKAFRDHITPLAIRDADVRIAREILSLITK